MDKGCLFRRFFYQRKYEFFHRIKLKILYENLVSQNCMILLLPVVLKVMLTLYVLTFDFKAAMIRREEKMRAEKEKMMQEEDPDRQRRLEVRLLGF